MTESEDKLNHLLMKVKQASVHLIQSDPLRYPMTKTGSHKAESG